MARLFDDGASQYLEIATPVITAVPLTFAGWYRPDGGAATHENIIVVSDTGGNTNYFRLSALTQAVYNGKIQMQTTDAAGSVQARTTTGWTANTWHHVCGVSAATNSRAVYIDAGSKGTDANDRTPAGLDVTTIGALHRLAGLIEYASARLAELCIWQAALTDMEVVALWRGRPPWEIRPDALRGYWPLRYGRTWDRDWTRRGYHMTPTNGPTWVPHPPVPERYWLDEQYGLYRVKPPRLARGPVGIFGERGVLRGVGRGVGRGI